MKSTCTIYGAIRLASNDCIGIPVFTHRLGGNALYVAETGPDLRISRFVQFIDDEHYRIDTSVKQIAEKTVFEIGDPIHIPFWIDGCSYLIDSRISLESLDQDFRQLAQRNIFTDIRSIIAKTRTGAHFSEEIKFEIQQTSDEFPDILEEKPSHTKYWVSRFRAFCRRLEEMDGKWRKEGYSLEQLVEQYHVGREKVSEFIRTYWRKGDLRLILSLAQAAEPKIISHEEARQIIFHQMVERTLINEPKKSTYGLLIELAQKYFPRGIFNYVRQEFRPSNEYVATGSAVMRGRPEAISGELLSYYRSLVVDERMTGPKLDRAYLSTIVMFGSEELPLEFRDFLHATVNWRLSELRKLIDEFFKGEVLYTNYEFDGDSVEFVQRSIKEKDLLREIENVEVLSRLVNNEIRMERPDVTRLHLGTQLDVLKNMVARRNLKN